MNIRRLLLVAMGPGCTYSPEFTLALCRDSRMSMKFRTLVILLAGVAIGVSLSLSRGVLADRDPPPSPETLPWEDARLLAEVLERVKQDYVDKVDDHDLMESAIRGNGVSARSAFRVPRQRRIRRDPDQHNR